MEKIHASALIDSNAKVDNDVHIGAFTMIGPNVTIETGCKIHSNVVISGHTTIGKNTEIYPFCSIGERPQDLTYKGEPTKLIIGKNNVIREYVSIHRGTMKDKGVTSIGNNNLLMAHVHLGHDVVFGDHCIIANSTNFAGHVKVGNRVIIGGGTNVSQFVSLGHGSYIGGASGIDRDIPMFCTAYGNRIKLKGINIIGMRRQGYEKATISEVVDFFRSMESSILSPRAFVDSKEAMRDYADNEVIEQMANEIRSSEVGIAPFI